MYKMSSDAASTATDQEWKGRLFEWIDSQKEAYIAELSTAVG
jgi:hypothetical protein